MIGQRLLHYQIVEKLGEGGMGVVYKARDTHLDRFVGIKVLPPEKVADPARKARFVQEAKAASALNHPNIIHIYDISSDAGTDFIAMEYVAGKTLNQLIGRKGLSLNETLKYAIQIADALVRAHGAGIVHRDLKPSNVMVDEHGLVKVLDFGLAKLTEAPSTNEATPTETLRATTEEGTIVGTAAYMSPEQAEGKKVDARSDIFSFGALLYEMVTGRRAFQGDSRMSTLSAVMHQEPKPIADVPSDLKRIINHCLRKDPERRFQSIKDLKVELEELKEESDSGTLSAAQAPAMALRGDRKLWGAVAAVLAVSLGAGGAYLWTHRAPPAKRPPVIRRLTSDSGLTTLPAISPDGKLLAYASDRAGKGILDIWVQQLAGGDAVRLTDGRLNCAYPSFSADGSRIAYVMTEGRGGALMTVSTLGGQPRRIADLARPELASPKFAPAGERIAYFSVSGMLGLDNNGGDFYIADSGGSAIRKIELKDGLLASAGFAWTPDAKGVLLAHGSFAKRTISCGIFPANGGAPIFDQLVATTSDNQVLPGQRFVRFESWIPDGVVVSAQSADTWAFVLIPDPQSADTWAFVLMPRLRRKPPETLLVVPGAESSMRASADDRRMEYSVITAADRGIWMLPMDVAQGKPLGPARRLMESLRSDSGPSPSANGARLAFAAGNPPDIWLLDMATGHQTRITATATAEDHPVLSRTGSNLAYRAVEDGKNAIYVASPGRGMARRMCENCGYPYAWADGETKLLYDHTPDRREIRILDIATGQSATLLKHSLPIFSPHLSPDEKWITFITAPGGRRRLIYVAPMRWTSGIPQSEWIVAVDGNDLDRQPVWSGKGDGLYFLSQRDGYQCIWEQKLDRVSRKPDGQAFAIQHMHDARYNTMAFSDPSEIGLSASETALFFSMMEWRANIWLAEFQNK